MLRAAASATRRRLDAALGQPARPARRRGRAAARADRAPRRRAQGRARRGHGDEGAVARLLRRGARPRRVPPRGAHRRRARSCRSGSTGAPTRSSSRAPRSPRRGASSTSAAQVGLAPEFDVDEARFPGPFDFARQAAMVSPDGLPEPNDPAFVARRRGRDPRARRGHRRPRVRALHLEPQHDRAPRARSPDLPYQILLQGERPKARLLEAFRAEPSVLFATASFWEGVDVPGDALSLVVIDRLPFAPPGDPVVAARLRALEAEGRDGFSELQVPGRGARAPAGLRAARAHARRTAASSRSSTGGSSRRATAARSSPRCRAARCSAAGGGGAALVGARRPAAAQA